MLTDTRPTFEQAERLLFERDARARHNQVGALERRRAMSSQFQLDAERPQTK